MSQVDASLLGTKLVNFEANIETDLADLDLSGPQIRPAHAVNKLLALRWNWMLMRCGLGQESINACKTLLKSGWYGLNFVFVKCRREMPKPKQPKLDLSVVTQHAHSVFLASFIACSRLSKVSSDMQETLEANRTPPDRTSTPTIAWLALVRTRAKTHCSETAFRSVLDLVRALF